MRLAVAVLAGGESRRMGRDKALLPREGTTLLALTVALAAQVVDRAAVFVVGRERPSVWPETDKTIFLPDDHPGDGPLAAIATALDYAVAMGCDRAAVLPCDLPLLTADALRWLVGQATEAKDGEDGVAIVGDAERVEPLFSVYATRCRERVEAQLAQGKRSPTALIERGDFRRVVAPDFVRLAIADADTPEDWQELTGTFVSRFGSAVKGNLGKDNHALEKETIMSDANPSITTSTDAFGETDPSVTRFDPNYQGDPATKLESPEDQNVLERNDERDPPGTHDQDVATDPGGGPTSGAGLTEEMRRIHKERAAGTGGHEGPAV